MLPFQRRELILKEAKQGTTYITRLADALGVSEITIRRDLKSMEKEGLVEVHHGGAVQFAINTARETGMEVREKIFSAEKDVIGAYAASLVSPGDVLFVDSGSTTKAMIPYLKGKKDITLVTNGYLNLGIALSNNIPGTIMLGGQFKQETYSFLGSITEGDLSSFYFDKSFIGVNGVDKEIGLTNANLDESALKRKAIERSANVFTLVDHSKFGKKSNYGFASIHETNIITDQTPKEYESLDNVYTVNTEEKNENQ